MNENAFIKNTFLLQINKIDRKIDKLDLSWYWIAQIHYGVSCKWLSLLIIELTTFTTPEYFEI